MYCLLIIVLFDILPAAAVIEADSLAYNTQTGAYSFTATGDWNGSLYEYSVDKGYSWTDCVICSKSIDSIICDPIIEEDRALINSEDDFIVRVKGEGAILPSVSDTFDVVATDMTDIDLSLGELYTGDGIILRLFDTGLVENDYVMYSFKDSQEGTWTTWKVGQADSSVRIWPDNSLFGDGIYYSKIMIKYIPTNNQAPSAEQIINIAPYLVDSPDVTI